MAIQLKLNELIAAHQFASNRLVNAENMTEEEMKVIQKYYLNFSQFTKTDKDLQQSHSIEEDDEIQELKMDGLKIRRAGQRSRYTFMGSWNNMPGSLLCMDIR